MDRLSWLDVHLWAQAEHYGLQEILSAGFEHGRFEGGVTVRNPFLAYGFWAARGRDEEFL